MTQTASSFAVGGSSDVPTGVYRPAYVARYGDYTPYSYQPVSSSQHMMPHWRRQVVQHGPQALPRLSPSRSKKEFLEHMGISEDNENDKRLYRDMMSEAAAARERMCSHRENLTIEAQMNPKIQPPYSSSMIKEEVQYREVQYIYQRALAHTKALYEKGNFIEGRNWDNWVIRWCLWHVFRYRDERNRNRGQRPLPVLSFDMSMDGASANGDRSEDERHHLGESSNNLASPLSPRSPRPSVYDPIRDSHRHNHALINS